MPRPRALAPAPLAPAQLSLFDRVEPPPAASPPAAGAPATTPAPAPARPQVQPPAVAPPDAILYRHPQADHEVRLGDHRVGYALRRARRRSVGFVVDADGLTVSAPRWVSRADLEAALHEKSAWILRQLHTQRERHRRLEAARIDWRDGARFPFLGETVQVVLAAQVTGAVLYVREPAPDGPRLALRLALPDGAAPEQVRDTVHSWLQRQARRIFEERAAVFAARLGVTVRRLSLSSAQTRWGSASADGSIRLNWRLVHFALPTIDYVVAHELAHLRHMDHGPRFWDVVRSVVPDVDAARSTLRQHELPPMG